MLIAWIATFLQSSPLRYVKMLEPIEKELSNPEKGIPYKGAKEHFILNIDNEELAVRIATILEEIIPLAKSKKKKTL